MQSVLSFIKEIGSIMHNIGKYCVPVKLESPNTRAWCAGY